MVQLNHVLEVVPHYLVMLVLIFLVLSVVRTALDGVSFWVELLFILAIALLYPLLVRRLGIAPTYWQKG